MSTRRPLVAGNWKLQNGLAASESLARAVASGLDAGERPRAEVVIAPVFTALASVVAAVRGSSLQVGAQDLHWEDKGAFTGEVSGPLLADVGCSHVIVGHSERRQLFGETDAGVRRKVEAAIRAGLTPIACVGETLEEREAGRTLDVVLRQTDAIVTELSNGGGLVLAYEPVWAIGTGRVASPEDAQEVHAAIRARVASLLGGAAADALRILYGGSVKPDNAGALLGRPDIDGALVGGASLDASQFLSIVRAA